VSNALTSYGAASAPPPARKRPALSRRQKAAILVRLLLKEGAALRLDELPETMQAELTHEMGALRLVDRETLESIVAEFMAELRDCGAAFPGGVASALALLDGALSESNLQRLRRETGVIVDGDPWDMIAELEAQDLAQIVARESTEIAAVILSKLPVRKSADVLGALPGETARRITYAVSTTGTVDPATVRTIGHAIAAQLAEEPKPAFPDGAAVRIGAILNSSTAATRDGVLEGIEEEDADLGAEVRKAIFTFADIPARIATRDVPRITRAVDQDLLITALAGATAPAESAAGEYILANMSQRLAGQLREDVAERERVSPADAEAAMGEIVAAIRDMEAAGELNLVERDD